MATVPVGVRLDEELVKRIDNIEERTGVSRTEIIERCVAVGLEDEEEFVRWLESPIKGPFVNLLLHPKVLGMLLKLAGGDREVDAIQQKVRKGIKEKKRLGKARPATE